MAPRTPSERVLAGRIGAYVVHSRSDSRELTAAARAAFRDKFQREVDPDGTSHRILTGNHQVGAWRASRLPAGRPLAAPVPLFRKLDPAIIDDELQLMGSARRAAGVTLRPE